MYRPPLLFLLSLLGLLQAAPILSEPASGYGPAGISGVFMDPVLGEISGMAASHLKPDRYWVHNDGDDGPVLYAVTAAGVIEGRVHIDGVRNRDWEDLAAFVWKGRPMLAVGDIGDNGGVRDYLEIHVIAEPELASGQDVVPAWSLRFKPEDEPHDYEALAVDPGAAEFLLITKRTVPARLYRLPLRPTDPEPHAAFLAGPLQGISQPDESQRGLKTPLGRYRAQPTAMDIGPDDRQLFVLTYGELYLYARQDKEPWEATLRRTPVALGLPALPQAEAMTVDDSGRILVTTENWPAPILQFTRDP